MGRQAENTFNRFDALGDMLQEEGIPIELSSKAKIQHENQVGDMYREDQILDIGDLLAEQLEIDVPPPIQEIGDLGGVQELQGSTLGAKDPLRSKGTSDSVKNNKALLLLGIQQKAFKKGNLDKPLKSGRKTDQERVKIMGEHLVEFGSVKPIDSHFSHPHK